MIGYWVVCPMDGWDDTTVYIMRTRLKNSVRGFCEYDKSALLCYHYSSFVACMLTTKSGSRL